MKRAEADCWKKTLGEAKGEPKDFWKIARQLTGQVKDDNNTSIHDDLVKSTTMNSFFATVGEKLASHFPPTTADKSYIARVTPTISEVELDSDGFYSKLRKVSIEKT